MFYRQSNNGVSVLDTSSGSSLVHAIIKLNETIDADLPSGTSVAVDVIGGKAEDAVLIPVEALHDIGDGKYTVFVMENNTQAAPCASGLTGHHLCRDQIRAGAGELVTTGIVETQ